jgi:hypothetical protein
VAWWNGSGGPGRTGAGLLLGELVDEHGDADGMGGLGRDKEVVVVVDDEADEHERGHAGDDGEEGLDLGRLPAQPRQRRSHGPPRAPHLVPLAFRTPPLSIGQGESRLVSLSLSLSLSLVSARLGCVLVVPGGDDGAGSGWCIGFDFVALMDSSCGPRAGKNIFTTFLFARILFPPLKIFYWVNWVFFAGNGSTGFDYSRDQLPWKNRFG